LDYSSIIDRLEQEIRQYRVEYQRFFNGDTKAPPEESAAMIRQRLNQLTTAAQLSSVDRFRLGGLEGHYNSLSDLFRRRLRDMDIPLHVAASKPQPATAAHPSVVVGESTAPDGIGSLYEALYSTKHSPAAPEDFHAYVLDQATKVRQRTGCSNVRFTVRYDGGKKRLKARPMPSDEAS